MTPSDEQLEAAVQALSDPGRFEEAEATIARVAPQLQRILAAALDSGGWFGESSEAEVRRALESGDAAAMRTLLAEEARMGMMVGVAVGWALAEELRSAQDGDGQEE